jgi:hypothetical protein
VFRWDSGRPKQAQQNVAAVWGNQNSQSTPETGSEAAVEEDVCRVFRGLTTDLTRSILDNFFPGQVNAALDATVVDKPTKEAYPRGGLVAPNKDSLSTAHPLATAHDTVKAPCVQIASSASNGTVAHVRRLGQHHVVEDQLQCIALFNGLRGQARHEVCSKASFQDFTHTDLGFLGVTKEGWEFGGQVIFSVPGIKPEAVDHPSLIEHVVIDL